MKEFKIIPNGKRYFFKQCPPHPRDTGIPLKHDYIFIKEVYTPKGSRITGGGTMSYTTVGLGEGGMKVTRY